MVGGIWCNKDGGVGMGMGRLGMYVGREGPWIVMVQSIAHTSRAKPMGNGGGILEGAQV